MSRRGKDGSKKKKRHGGEVEGDVKGEWVMKGKEGRGMQWMSGKGEGWEGN